MSVAIVERALFAVLEQALADRRVIVITGMRRVGKTTSLRWLLERLEAVRHGWGGGATPTMPAAWLRIALRARPQPESSRPLA